MKAKVKETNEIVNVTPVPTWYYENEQQGPDRRCWDEDELEFNTSESKEKYVKLSKVEEFLSSVDLNFYREWEDKFNTDELIVDLEKYLEDRL